MVSAIVYGNQGDKPRLGASQLFKKSGNNGNVLVKPLTQCFWIIVTIIIAATMIGGGGPASARRDIRGVRTGMTLDIARQIVEQQDGKCAKLLVPKTDEILMICLYRGFKQSMMMLATPAGDETIFGIKYLFDNADPRRSIEIIRNDYHADFDAGACFSQEYRMPDGDLLSLCMRSDTGGTLRFMKENVPGAITKRW